jgi:hypothetical protein
LSSHTPRDPFNLPRKSAQAQSNDKIKLLGIIQSASIFDDSISDSKKFGAVLELDGHTETVFVKDNFFGFKVLSIEHDNILLLNGRRKKKLYIE